MENPQGNNVRIPCAYCTLYGKRCRRNCNYAPHFPISCFSTFQIADRLYGKKNISKMMKHADIDEKSLCATSILGEASAWSQDPQFGVVGFMRKLHWKIKLLEDHHTLIKNMIRSAEEQQQSPLPPPPPPPSTSEP